MTCAGKFRGRGRDGKKRRYLGKKLMNMGILHVDLIYPWTPEGGIIIALSIHTHLNVEVRA